MKKIALVLAVLTTMFSCEEDEPGTTTIYEQITPPTYSVMAGTYAQDIEVAISTNAENATIYYTLDGTEPTENSTVYAAPIAISGDKTDTHVKAIWVDGSGEKSSVSESFYRINSEHNPDTYNKELTIEEFQSAILGKWIGGRVCQWTDDTNVEVTFNSDGSYTSKALTGDISAFYYGPDEEENSYHIFDINADGTGMGYLHRNSNTNRGEISYIKFSEDMNVVNFEFWYSSDYGPFTFTLTRVEE